MIVMGVILFFDKFSLFNSLLASIFETSKVILDSGSYINKDLQSKYAQIGGLVNI